MSLTIQLEAQGSYNPLPDRQQALEAWAAFRKECGLSHSAVPLWTLPESQPKTGLNDRYTASLNLTAGREALCVNTRSCEDTCVTNESFRARSSSIRYSRWVKTQFLIQHPREFGAVLLWDTERLLAKHPEAMARPNCNQDVAWERVFPWLPDVLPLYDYTKRLDRVGWLHSQYRTTYSATSTTRESTVRRLIDRGDTVTMVFPHKKHQLPEQWRGIPVLDGDVSDDRYNDPSGVIVGLSWKGQLRGKHGHPLLTPPV